MYIWIYLSIYTEYTHMHTLALALDSCVHNTWTTIQYSDGMSGLCVLCVDIHVTVCVSVHIAHTMCGSYFWAVWIMWCCCPRQYHIILLFIFLYSSVEFVIWGATKLDSKNATTTKFEKKNNNSGSDTNKSNRIQQIHHTKYVNRNE